MAHNDEDEDILTLFDLWCKHCTDITAQLADVEDNMKKGTSQAENTMKHNIRLQAECSSLQEVVNQCQHQLHVLCDRDEEMCHLKTLLAEKDKTLEDMAQQCEATIQTLKVKHEEEMQKKLCEVKDECDKKLTDAENQLKDQAEANVALQSQLQKWAQEKEKEISCLVIEHESKLTMAQRLKAQYKQQQQQILNQDVMRKKMQHMKENYDHEIASLRQQIRDLENNQQLSRQNSEFEFEQHCRQQPKSSSYDQRNRQTRRLSIAASLKH